MSSSNTNAIWRWVRHIGAICLFGVAIYFLLKLAFPYGINSGSIDIQLHDTYFVISLFHAPVLLTVITYSLFTFFYQLFLKWKNPIVNITQLIFLGLFIVLWSWITYAFWPVLEKVFTFQTQTEGWTIYPPLSALPKEMPPPPASTWYSPLIFWTIFLIPIIYFLYCIYRTIKNLRTKN